MVKKEGGLRTKGRIKTSSSDKPLVSVITTVLNGETYIEDAIRSIRRQGYDNIEHIIVDGGSEDRTVDIIREYEDAVDCWVSEPDRGSSDALNKGLSLARGELIGILNSDDWYEEGAVGSAVDVYLADGNIGLIYGNTRYHHNGGSLFVKLQADDAELRRSLVNVIHILLPSVFFRRDCYLKFGGFNPDVVYANDGDILVRYFKKGVKFHYLDRVITNMRTGGRGEINFVEARKEIARILINGGYPSYKAFAWCYMHNVKQRIALKIGLNNPLLRFYRSFSGKKTKG